MAASAPAADPHGGDDDEESTRDESLFILQENHKFKYSAISLLFSVEDHDDVDYDTQHMFEEFFHDMELEKHNPTVEKIHFGYMMDHLDWSQRWIYKGSKTIPPCNKYVYWNVIDAIYPIEETTLRLF